MELCLRTAQVDVGALTATTSNLSNADFMAGRLQFNEAGKPGATVENQGRITVAEGGFAALVGRQAIVALNLYLERQRRAEAMPAPQRRQGLGYDLALARLAKNVCPGCERPVDLKDGKTDFCPHCGMGLFDHCGHCNARKSAFARFCQACGQAAGGVAGGYEAP